MIEEIKAGIMENARLRCEIAQKHYDWGMRDCEAGVYDKWYRYNAEDGGIAYEAGWTEKNKEVQNESVKFIEISLNMK